MALEGWLYGIIAIEACHLTKSYHPKASSPNLQEFPNLDLATLHTTLKFFLTILLNV